VDVTSIKPTHPQAVELGSIRAQTGPSATAASMHHAALRAGGQLEVRVPSRGPVPAGFATSTGKRCSPVLSKVKHVQSNDFKLKRRRALRLVVNATALIFLSGVAMAETINFDHESAGSLPAGWAAGVTGHGSPKWTIEKDDNAVSPPNVLKQSGSGTFPWCIKTDTSIENGSVEVKFKPISGREDAAGGVVWRWKDRDNYYVARANALENNVSLYHTTNGRRTTIKYVNAPVSKNQWHSLKVDFVGTSIRVALDGTVYIDELDDHIFGAGAVGVWTKADSVTAFDDFSFSPGTGR